MKIEVHIPVRELVEQQIPSSKELTLIKDIYGYMTVENQYLFRKWLLQFYKAEELSDYAVWNNGKHSNK